MEQVSLYFYNNFRHKTETYRRAKLSDAYL